MAVFITPQKLDALFEKFQPGKEYNPEDGSSVEISASDKELIEAIFVQYEKIVNAKNRNTASSGDFFGELLEKFKEDSEALKNASKYLSYDTEEAAQVKRQLVMRQMSQVKSNLEKFAVGIRSCETSERNVPGTQEAT
jgi:hypothetical protein